MFGCAENKQDLLQHCSEFGVLIQINAPINKIEQQYHEPNAPRLGGVRLGSRSTGKLGRCLGGAWGAWLGDVEMMYVLGVGKMQWYTPGLPQ